MRKAPNGRLASKPSGPAQRRANENARANAAIRRGIDRALNDAQLRDSCRANPEDVALLREIARSPGRNAAAQLRALELQLAYGHGRPKNADGDAGEKALDVTLVRVVNEVLSLPPDVLRVYLDTGKLPPGSWLPGYQSPRASDKPEEGE